MRFLYPTTTFDGIVITNSLKIGAVMLGAQRIPAVRFLIGQSRQNFELFAHGRQSGEVYAYALAASRRGEAGLEAHVVAYTRVSVERGMIFVVATDDDGLRGIIWHSGSEMRAGAAQILVEILNGETPPPTWPMVEKPFAFLTPDG
ncbi:MAG: hypothetical protein NT121_14465 [Chloroflexi bacterium]|nr:hypothetical protein [Chloroflexota bacterium]